MRRSSQALASVALIASGLFAACAGAGHEDLDRYLCDPATLAEGDSSEVTRGDFSPGVTLPIWGTTQMPANWLSVRPDWSTAGSRSSSSPIEAPVRPASGYCLPGASNFQSEEAAKTWLQQLAVEDVPASNLRGVSCGCSRFG